MRRRVRSDDSEAPLSSCSCVDESDLTTLKHHTVIDLKEQVEGAHPLGPMYGAIGNGQQAMIVAVVRIRVDGSKGGCLGEKGERSRVLC